MVLCTRVHLLTIEYIRQISKIIYLNLLIIYRNFKHYCSKNYYQMENSSSLWTWEQDKAFETALAMHFEDYSEAKWAKIASQIPGNKTIEDVKQHYHVLFEDIMAIESGMVPIPSYTPSGRAHNFEVPVTEEEYTWESRKGQPWSEAEHRQFLLGLDRYGKGDWKSISKEFVKTRSATQVASHAQKYFKRQANKLKKDTKRWSIFDITAPNKAHPGIQNYSCSSSGSGSGSSNYEYAPKGNEMNSAINQAMFQEGFVEVQPMQQQVPVVVPQEYMSPPESWCLEDELAADFNVNECSSQLPPL
ncbi:transcription factor SRM1-like [Chenopodium quinoa]|uniref:transcription factor SRM1-like n=1 Tax=Chenopodium quinoa TaxID=63459 RepID=UPI000B7975A0|nr:transcription factor SRM1-like [Chenopodium quinoa]